MGSVKPRPQPSAPRPSSSILLLSPTNQILLLHRVKTSTSFASAHVFPGGNIDAFHDGDVPATTAAAAAADSSEKGHMDGPAYRMCAVRECFEETGILLARDKDGKGMLGTVLSDKEREKAREAVHTGKIRFGDWLDSVGGVADTDGLIPFTRWITPTNVPRRFTTQMYLYALPLSATTMTSSSSVSSAALVVPTPDGGKEHTEAVFAPASTWLSRQAKGEIILFPPQAYLLTLIDQHLRTGTYQEQRDKLMGFVRRVPTDTEDASSSSSSASRHATRMIGWGDKVMCPQSLFVRKVDGRVVLGLAQPGPELKNSGRGGDFERVVLARMGKEGPREVEVRLREEVLKKEKEKKDKKGSNL